MTPNRIINHIIIQSFQNENFGLFYGRMGFAITFYTLGSRFQEDLYSNYGNELLESILMNLDRTTPKDFANGLCGIGWGIEYLIHNGFIECASDNLLEEFDKIIIKEKLDISDLSLESGMEGLFHYILAHINGCAARNEKIPFNETYLTYLYQQVSNFQISLKLDLKVLTNAYVKWYQNKELSYSFNLEQFIEPYTIAEPLNTNPLFLHEGLSGYIITTEKNTL